MGDEKTAGGASREGTPLSSLPGFTVEPAPGGPGGSARPVFFLSHPQLEQGSYLSPPEQGGFGRHSDYDAESGGPASDADSISSSTGGLFTNIAIPIPKQPATKKRSLSPTPSFTYIDAKAAAAARKGTVQCCASKSVLKISLTFCFSFLLGMALTVIYMEVYLWRR